MKTTTTRRTVVLIAVGAIGLGGIAVAGPALAGAEMLTAPQTAVLQQCPGSGGGHGMHRGTGMRDGSCLGPGATAEQGVLTDHQKSTLITMAQKEKLAHDLYAAFASRYPLPVFDHIAMAETQHLSMVRALLERYKMSDPTASEVPGTFSNPSLQATYNRMVARGSTDQSAALQVSREVERTDIADLRMAITGLTAPDVTQVYQHLLRSSERHLSAFTTWANR